MKKEKLLPMKNISVGLYCHTDDDGFEDKIGEIQKFLIQNGGSCEVIRKKISKAGANRLIEFHANIPRWFANGHHNFDSKLNSTTNGFGVGWVE
jgi:hypothetical protein